MSNTINGDGNYNSFPDIHMKDGHLYKYNIPTRFPNEVKHKIIASLIDVINERSNQSIRMFGINGLMIIKQDIGHANNYQSTDGILADDILVEICDIMSVCSDDSIINTVVNHICEQMADMIRTNGTCPSGRVNRLIQVYMILKDYIDGVYLAPKSKTE
jgi:hypothetical protein